MEENTNLFENRIDLSELSEAIVQIKSEISKIIIGQKESIDLLISAILADGHVLIEGVPGVAKTLTAKIIARIISVDFSRIQFTPDLMPSDVLGTNIFNQKLADFEFKKGPIFSNIVLIDEINRAPAKTQAALFEVMEERQVSIDGAIYAMAPPFLVLATQNPIEQEGTYQLPEAQLDRFLFKIEVNYPNAEEEVDILLGAYERKSQHDLDKIQPIITAEQIQTFRGLVRKVSVDRNLMEYIAQIVDKTRQHPSLYLGGSPRASIAIMFGAQAYAAMQGRDFITPDDVKFMATPVLRHRLMLTPEKEMEGVAIEEVIQQIVEAIEIPR
ncbi:MAG: AAA family ATPase [Flammeovirgaceae bacterium]